MGTLVPKALPKRRRALQYKIKRYGLIALKRAAAPTGTFGHKKWLCLANRCVVIGRRGHRRCPAAVSCIKMANRLKQEIDMRFPDRFKAGQLLAEKLDHCAYRRDVIVLALPPGGVPVGYEVAKALNAPLDILVIRRLGFPNNPVLAMGAVCADGALVLNHELLRWLNIDGAKLDDVIAVERAKSQRLDKAYRNDALRLDLRDKFAILVDDGMTTASAMRTAIAILRLRHPARIVIAVPVASHSSVLDLLAQVDKVITYSMPNEFETVAQWHEDFEEISEESVRDLYERARGRFR
jgi:putative phosphoribosyl transferase